MYTKLLKNDFKRNTWNNAILLMFISLSVVVAVTVTILLTQLFTSISSMYKIANPPHFLQLHKGDISKPNLDKFNSTFVGLKHSQIVTLINIDGNEITISNEKDKNISLSECRLDISFVKQNNKYDVLLDKDRNPIEVENGEIVVPIILKSSFNIEIGDVLSVGTGNGKKEFKVKSFLYDGQMNSTLVSSTRFLISDDDFENLMNESYEKEYMIEAWFLDSKQASSYQNQYEESQLNLPKNGQAVTYTLIFLLSALTDLLIAMIFLLTGIFLIVISLICLRYSILADLEDDMIEIGTMKAIGISKKGICNLYLIKIKLIAFVGSILGLIIALVFSVVINRHLSNTFGNQKFEPLNFIFVALVIVGIYSLIVVFSKKILKRIVKLSVVDLLVTEKGFSGKNRKVHSFLKNKFLPFNLSVGLHKFRRGYGIVFVLMLIVSFFIMIPYRALQTMGDNEFSTYMGSPVYDILIDVEQGKDIERKNEILNTILKKEMKEGNIKEISTLRVVRLQGISNDGEILGIHTGSGENAGSGLKYLSGKSPIKDNEIALSYLVSDELKKDVGDKLEIIVGSTKKNFFVSGIYQDVTSGGKTAKTIYSFSELPSEKYSYGIKADKEKILEITNGLRNKLGYGYSIENMDEFLDQTLGNVIYQLKNTSIIVLMVGILMSCLIISLFIKLLMTREGYALALKKTMGIPLSSIKIQELYPILFSGGLGSIIGVILSELLGGYLISGIFSIFRIGLKEFIFVKIPIWQIFILPTILITILLIVANFILNNISKINVMRYINE